MRLLFLREITFTCGFQIEVVMKVRDTIAVAVLWQMSLFGQTVPRAEPSKVRRVEMRPLEVREPRTPEPQPEERFEIDRTAGVVRLHAVCADGFIRSFEATLSSQIAPQVVSEQAWATDGSVHYRYSLTNGSGARQSIIMFAVGMERPSSAQFTSIPERWRPGNVAERAGKLPPGQIWWAKDYATSAVAPAKTAGPFVIVSSDLPGLTEAYFRSDQPMTYPPEFHLASPWASMKFHEVLENEYYVKVWTMGPKIPRSQQRQELLAAIREEFQNAAQMAEFASMRKELLAVSENLAGPNERAVVMPQGQTPLQREFLSAMAINIVVLRSTKQ